MRRVFIFLSTAIMTLFFVWVISERSTQLRYMSYPSVTIMGTLGTQEPPSRGDFEKVLEDLANETHSLVARRIAEPQRSGKANFSYATYGQGRLPKTMRQASVASAKSSSLANSYLIIKGTLTKKKLLETFTQLGYQAVDFGEQSNPLYFFVSCLSKGAQFLALLIFLLTFLALTLIYRVRELRSAGIRLISGQALLEITVKTVKKDFFLILQAYVASVLLGLGFLGILGLFESYFILLIAGTTLCYSLLLAFVSLLLSGVYLLGLKKTSLIEVIKGKLPLRRLIILMLLGQLLAVVIVGNSVNRIIIYNRELQQQSLSQVAWRKEKNWFNLGFNLGGQQPYNKKEQDCRETIWYQLIQDGVTNHGTMLVQHNFANYMLSSQTVQGTRLTDYAPEGNTLFVTPNYFTNQKIDVPSHVMEQLTQLKEGQFGLILPKKLSKDSQQYIKIYEDYFAKMMGLEQVEAKVSYLPNHRSYFVFNQTPIASQQYVTDPIFLVLTPTSTGNGTLAKSFWNNALNYYLFFNGYDKTIEMLKDYGTYPWISYVENSQASYEMQVSNIQTEVISTLAGSVLGVLTSILLFNSMNLLYFEQFRRVIFIKRIAGMSPLSIHRNYLVAQFVVLLIGFATVVFMSQNLLISLVTLLLFIGCSLATLVWQLSAENRLAVTVLKGK